MCNNTRVYDAILAVLDVAATSPGNPIDEDGNLTDTANESEWSCGYTMGWEALAEMIRDAVSSTLSDRDLTGPAVA